MNQSTSFIEYCCIPPFQDTASYTHCALAYFIAQIYLQQNVNIVNYIYHLDIDLNWIKKKHEYTIFFNIFSVALFLYIL